MGSLSPKREPLPDRAGMRATEHQIVSGAIALRPRGGINWALVFSFGTGLWIGRSTGPKLPNSGFHLRIRKNEMQAENTIYFTYSSQPSHSSYTNIVTRYYIKTT